MEDSTWLADRVAFRVIGGKPINGVICPQGNKNEALPLLAACCLTDEPVVLENVPAIRDVSATEDILAELGVSVERTRPSTVRVHADSILRCDLPVGLCAKLRGAVIRGRVGARRLTSPSTNTERGQVFRGGR